MGRTDSLIHPMNIVRGVRNSIFCLQLIELITFNPLQTAVIRGLVHFDLFSYQGWSYLLIHANIDAFSTCLGLLRLVNIYCFLFVSVFLDV